MDSPKYTTGAVLLEAWERDVWEGEAPERWPIGPGAMATDVDFGPGQVLLVGGAPGAGKTALATAGIFDAVRETEGLRALVVSVEMLPEALLNRQLARLSGIPLSTIAARRARNLSELGRKRIHEGMAALRAVLPNVAFLEPPFDLEHVALAADDFEARALLLDYVQRIRAPGEHASQREGLEALMQAIRNMATAGAGVLVLSAVSRQKGRGGSDYSGLNLASFRGASELEFGADSAYVLTGGGEDEGPDMAALRCFKRRNGEPKDIMLRFERDVQRFTPLDFVAATADDSPMRDIYGKPIEWDDSDEPI